ncbi:MAG: FeoB-associated Cys-rich membrane protein [Clostridia bacterium]|nr:FeoB-associated Cys-rich membrane protein [Clostridia bacterium]
MANAIVIFVLILIVGAAAAYVIKAKKRGQKCIGCPYAKECTSQVCGCGCSDK